MATSSRAAQKVVETLVHDEASRKNIPTAEYESVLQKEQQDPVRVAYERRNRRFLHHRSFNTWAKRMGRVVHVGHMGIRVWRVNSTNEETISWEP